MAAELGLDARHGEAVAVELLDELGGVVPVLGDVGL